MREDSSCTEDLCFVSNLLPMPKRLERFKPVFYSHNNKAEDSQDLMILHKLCVLSDRASIVYI